MLDQVAMRPSVRAASISPDHRLPLVQAGVQHRLAAGLFPDTGSTLAVTCRCSNRPECHAGCRAVCLARQVRLGALGQLLRLRIRQPANASSANKASFAGLVSLQRGAAPRIPLWAARGRWCSVRAATTAVIHSS